ncbi:MAG: signal peptidase II [Ruminococcus sp.]|nr:signal peptidase II [Ruminococcus sp.]
MAVFLVVMIGLLVAADQLVKNWAVDVLQPVGSMDFIHFGDFKIIDLTYLENNGAIFGSMAGQRWFLVGFTALVIAVGIVAMFVLIKRSKLLDIAMGLFIAGGIGNLIDRMRFGYVVDMFEIKLFRFAIFNVADICVTVAFVLLLVYGIFIDPKIEKAERENGKEAEKNV